MGKVCYASLDRNRGLGTFLVIFQIIIGREANTYKGPSGDRALASEAMCAGSIPAGHTI